MTEGKSVELKIENGRLIVTPIDLKSVYSLEDLLAGMDPDLARGEVDYGRPVSDEFF